MQALETHIPRHEAVARKLEAEISLLGQNEKLPTMRQLMGKYQVSQFTIERCLQVLIEKELIEHVPGRGYFARKVDSGSETSPSNGKTVKIELCFFFKKDTLNNPLYGQISTLMLSEMSSKNCRFNIFAYEEMGCIKEFKKHLQYNRPDVFIMMSCTKVSFQHVLDDLGIPVIHLYSNIEDLNCISYIIDNYRAIKYSIDHLTDLGHEKIALLHGQGYDGFYIQAQEERIEAFYSIMAEKKLTPANVTYGGFTYEDGYNAAKKILELPTRRRPSAIMCNDYNAGGVYAAINDAGMEVGKDISVIGFDRIREIECLPVKLTTIDIHYAKMVKSIAQKAYALANGEKYVPKEIRTEVELIIGDSTGPVNIQK
jgi:DNA-binding LacI/PurR family transcriptional regulator